MTDIDGSALRNWGLALRTSRKRRRETQALTAQRLGINVKTLQRIEAGDPGVAAGHYVMASQLLGYGAIIEKLVDPLSDTEGVYIEDAKLKRGLRPRKDDPFHGF